MAITRRDILKFDFTTSSRFERPFLYQLSLFKRPFERPYPFQPPFSLQPCRTVQDGSLSIDYYFIPVRKSSIELIPGFQTEILGFYGQFPGPIIRQRRNHQCIIRFINQLGNSLEKGEETPISTCIHLQGIASSPQYDGYSEDLIPPGYFKDYIYSNDVAGTFCYRDNAFQATARNVYCGLIGMYIIEDEEEHKFNLPQGEYDVPLILQDISLDREGQLIFDNHVPENFFGNINLVNGVPWPRMAVANRKYRFRILNASISREYQLALNQAENRRTFGDELIVIGNEAGLLSAPVEFKTTVKNPFEVLRINSTECYEVIIDFSKYPLGSRVFLRDIGIEGGVAPYRQPNLMCFDVVREEPDDSQIPNTIRPIRRLSPAMANRTRSFRFERKASDWVINGYTWNANYVMANPEPGDIEIWELVNPSGFSQSIYFHLFSFQILDRNGRPPMDYERGWKNSCQIPPRGIVRIICQFPNSSLYFGRYMFYSSNLVRKDHGMMAQFEVGPGGDSPLSDPARPFPQNLEDMDYKSLVNKKTRNILCP